MAIAFLPIDIDIRLPDEKKLLEYCDEFKLPKIKDNVDAVVHWDLVPVIGSGESVCVLIKVSHAIHKLFSK